MNKKQLKRMLELSDIKTLTENRNELSTIELVKMASNDKVYSIVRENRTYYIKTTDKVENLTESDFDYIGGVHNKPKFSYNSFEDATRKLNLVFEDINRSTGGDVTNILESDIELLDEKKFVLKQPKKAAPAPEMDFSDDGGFDFGSSEGDAEGGDEPSFDFGSSEGDAEGGDDFEEFGDTEGDSEGGDDFADFGGDELEDDEDLEDLDGGDPIKDIQKTTGQLGQQLRDTEDLSSDMNKWVAKSVLAALDLDGMDSSDKKDLIKTIKAKKEEDTEVIDTEDDNSGEDFEVEESYDSYMEDDFTYDELSMTDIDMGIQDKGYLNLDPSVASASDSIYGPNDEYDSYMGEDENTEGMCPSCKGSGCSHCAGLGFVDTIDENNPNIGGDEELNTDNLLLDDEENDYTDPIAKSKADRDMSSHYNKPAAPGYDELPSDQWRGHRLPDDTEFNFDDEYDSYMGEDEYTTIEDELGLPPATSSTDETDYEHTSLDNTTDFDDSLENNGKLKYDSYMSDELDPTMSPSPAPARPAPTTEPGTKPGKPDTDRPARPSKRPFTPPPHIRPGDEPGPKAKNEDLDITYE